MTTSVVNPALFARESIEIVISNCLSLGGQYGWNHRDPERDPDPDVSAISSGVVEDPVDIMYGTEQLAAARATAHSPSLVSVVSLG